MEATTLIGSRRCPREAAQDRASASSDIVFFIVAASAPLTVIAGGVATTYLVTGNAGVPLLFIVLGAILALFVDRLRGDEPPHHQRGRVLRLRLERDRQGAGRR